MNTNALKKRIHNFVEEADEQMLQLINALIDSEETGLSSKHKRILDERLKFHALNPNDGKPWEEVRNVIAQRYGI